MDDKAYDRPRIWVSKDTLPRELQFLQPLNASSDQTARIMVGPRQTIVAGDAADQTLAASAASIQQFSANTIVTGSFSVPSQVIGIAWEQLRAYIVSRDTSAKLEITIPLILNYGPNSDVPLGAFPTPIPMLFPAIIGAQYEINALVPMRPYLPTDGAIGNGPVAIIGLTNTDGAASHVFRRAISMFYRYIYDVDYSKERVYVVGTLI